MKKNSPSTTAHGKNITRHLEMLASIGMLLIAISLVLPLFQLTSTKWLSELKWVYSGGALLYLVARIAGATRTGDADSMRLRRLLRMPAWAGVAFAIAAGFWFYSEAHLGPYAGPLAVLRQTILFSLVGAVLQIVSSWMIYSCKQKEQKGDRPK